MKYLSICSGIKREGRCACAEEKGLGRHPVLIGAPEHAPKLLI